MSDERLQVILQSGDEQKCLEFFHGMPEKNRREHFPQVKAFFKEVQSNRFVELGPGQFASNSLLEIAAAAFFATATFSEIQQAKRNAWPSDDAALAVLSDRRPDWIDRWIATLLDDTYYWGHWRLIRRLIAAGLAQKPDSPKYYLGMIGSLARPYKKTPLAEVLLEAPDLLQHDVWKLFEYDGEGENSLANSERFGTNWSATLVAFMNEGKLSRTKLLESSLEALERDFNHYRARWFHEFYDLLEPTEDELRQHADRFLGLLRATAPNVASWALAKVERLAEMGAYQTEALTHALEPILQARAKGTVLQALRLIERQASAHPEQQAAAAATAATALRHEKADVQTAAIAFLERVASPKDATVRRAVEKHADSVAASVRSRLAKWLAMGETPLAAANDASSDTKPAAKKPKAPRETKAATAKNDHQANAAAATIATIAPELRSLLAIDALEKNLKEGVLSIPAATFNGTEIARLTQLDKLKPIEDVEALIDLCARVIEDASGVDDVERCIDGMARLCGSKPQDLERLAGPLLKRVRQLVKKRCSPFFGLDPGNDILGLVYAFCTGKVIEPSRTTKSKYGSSGATYDFEGETYSEFVDNMRKPIGFLSLRCLELAGRLVRGQSFSLLSIPTHEQGWLDPRELAVRVNNWTSDAPDATDVILAMLRLAPEHRQAALEALRAKPGEWVQAIRYALGADKVPIGNEAPLWIAAARARTPWKDDERILKKFPDLGPDAGAAAKIAFQFKTRKSGGYTFVDAYVESTPAPPKSVGPLLVTVAMHAYRAHDNMLMFELGGFAGKTNGAVRWTATIWPQARESYFAGCAQDCLNNLDWSEAAWQNRTALEPLLDSGTPLKHAGLILLTGMLGAKEPGESGLATDIAIRAVEDGRLGSDNLGAAVAELLPSGLIKPGRWQKTLAEVARASQVHAAVVQVALQQCFAQSSSKPRSKAAPQPLPKDSSKLIELLYELSVELGLPISNEGCRAYLEASGSSGKAGKLAKSLLQLEASSDTSNVIQTMLQGALKQRIAAAGRLVKA